MTAAKDVAVLDYGFGDVDAAERALAGCGARAEVTADFDRAMGADGLLLTGAGPFAACVAALRRARGHWLVGRRLAGGRPVLATGVGMHLLFARGEERGGASDGLGEWPGTVRLLAAAAPGPAPDAAVRAPAGSRLFAGLPDGERFRFGGLTHGVHDWELPAPGGAAPLAAPRVAWATAHGERFVAAVENGPLWATQFLPERSGAAGSRLLTNWIESL